MFLLVGLGNPGPKYAGNRHNIGFMAIDEIARQHNISPWRKKFQGESSEGLLGGEKVLLLKPSTYMNESGRAIAEACRFYKIAPEDVFVFHDELDLAPGKVKAKLGGGVAGHNGLRSTNAHIGANFHRIRLGIGHPGRDRVTQWVLNDFAKADRDWLEPLLDALARNAPALIKGDLGRFMTDVSRTLAPEPPKKKKSKPDKQAEDKTDGVKSATADTAPSTSATNSTEPKKTGKEPTKTALADALMKLISKQKDQ